MKDWGTVCLEGCGHIMGWRDEEDAQCSLLTKYLELDMRKPLTRDPKRRFSRAKRESYQCQCSRGIVTQFVKVQEIKC